MDWDREHLITGKWASDVMKRTLTKSKSKSRVTVFALFLARVNAVHHSRVNTVLDIVIETERKPDSTISPPPDQYIQDKILMENVNANGNGIKKIKK